MGTVANTRLRCELVLGGLSYCFTVRLSIHEAIEISNYPIARTPSDSGLGKVPCETFKYIVLRDNPVWSITTNKRKIFDNIFVSLDLLVPRYGFARLNARANFMGS